MRVGIYGTGNFANRTHLPNLSRLEHVELVAATDVNADALAATAGRFAIPCTYDDAHEMLIREKLDVLYSIVPAFVGASAGRMGIGSPRR